MNMSAPSGPAGGLDQIAFNDVCCAREPTMPENPMYMARYTFWRSLAGENHFDPNYEDDSDGY